MPRTVIAIAISIIAASHALANEHRSRAVAREFRREHPYPSTELTSSPCPGYWRDQIVQLACGEPDAGSEHAMANDRGSAG